MKYYLLITLISLGICTQYTTIEKDYNGLTRGTSDVIHIEAFYCLLCPNSKVSYFQLKDVFDALGPTKFTYTIHQFPLPYHKNAFTLTQGYRYIQNLNVNAAIEYAEWVFNNQQQFTDSATLGMSQNDVNAIITSYVKSQLIPKYNTIVEANFALALKPGTPENLKTRFSWKYATHRNIVGTPMFLVNNVHLDGAEEWDALRWTDYIKARNSLKTDI